MIGAHESLSIETTSLQATEHQLQLYFFTSRTLAKILMCDNQKTPSKTLVTNRRETTLQINADATLVPREHFEIHRSSRDKCQYPHRKMPTGARKPSLWGVES